MRYSIFLLLSIFFIGCSDGKVNGSIVKTNSDNNGTEKNTTVPKDDENLSKEPDDGNIAGTNIDTGNSEVELKEVDMVLKSIYRVKQGDSLEEIDDARVRIIRNSENSFSEVILLSGSAKIVRGGEN